MIKHVLVCIMWKIKPHWQPYNKSFLEAACTFVYENTPITFEVPIIYKSKDPIKGEVKEAINIMPEITCALQDDVLILKNKNSKL